MFKGKAFLLFILLFVFVLPRQILASDAVEISNVEVLAISKSSALIQWKTNIPDKTKVYYSVSPACVNTQTNEVACAFLSDASAVSEHKIMLAGGVGNWTPGNKLYYQIEDSYGKRTGIFEATIGDITIEARNLKVLNNTSSGFSISWTTNIKSNNIIKIYEKSTNSLINTINLDDSSINHEVNFNGLKEKTWYTVYIESYGVDYPSPVPLGIYGNGSYLYTNYEWPTAFQTASSQVKPDLILTGKIYINDSELSVNSSFNVGKLLDIDIFYINQGADFSAADLANPIKSKMTITNNGVIYFEKEDYANSMGNTGSWEWTPTKAGTYTIKLIVDSDNIINESNEDNNIFTKTITIVGIATKPDLAFIESSFKYYISDGKQPGWPVAGLPLVYVEVEDKNKAYNHEYEGWTMTVEADGKSNVYAQSTVSDYVRSYTINLIGVGITAYDNKQHSLVLAVDKSNVLAEADETNNTLRRTVSFNNSVKPDLIIAEIKTVPENITINASEQIIAFHILQKNIGQGDTPNKGDGVGGISGSTPSGCSFVDASPNWSPELKAGQAEEWIMRYKCAFATPQEVKFEFEIDPNNRIDESNESNNDFSKTIIVHGDKLSNKDDQIERIVDRAKDLFQNKLDPILSELKLLRNIIKEQQNEIKYLKSLTKDLKAEALKLKDAINNFITYGVDENTKKLGEGERAAVIHSFKAAFNKLPETEEELADTIKIANGRWPSITNDNAEKKAKERFIKIYKRVADMSDPKDNAAVTVMAYGLRQKAANRNLSSEKAGIKIFKSLYGHTPKSTEEWNTMQAITYSGSSRKTDTDNDLLADETEKKFGTNPDKADTDGDGYKDGTEVNGGYDPLKK